MMVELVQQILGSRWSFPGCMMVELVQQILGPRWSFPGCMMIELVSWLAFVAMLVWRNFVGPLVHHKIVFVAMLVWQSFVGLVCCMLVELVQQKLV